MEQFPIVSHKNFFCYNFFFCWSNIDFKNVKPTATDNANRRGHAHTPHPPHTHASTHTVARAPIHLLVTVDPTKRIFIPYSSQVYLGKKKNDLPYGKYIYTQQTDLFPPHARTHTLHTRLHTRAEKRDLIHLFITHTTTHKMVFNMY